MKNALSATDYFSLASILVISTTQSQHVHQMVKKKEENLKSEIFISVMYLSLELWDDRI